MLRLFVLFFIVSIFSSCNDLDKEVKSERDGFITTREDNYNPQRSNLENNINGVWLENNTDSIKWVFNNQQLKWKGFSHIVSFKEKEINIGNLAFEVTQVHTDSLILFNRNTKVEHELIRVPG